MSSNVLKFFVITFLLLVINMRSIAQENSGKEDDSSMIYDEEDSTEIVEEATIDTAITKNTFDEEKNSLAKWKHSKDFSYIAYLDSLLRKTTAPKTDTISIDANTGKKRRAGSPDDSNSLLNSYPLKIFFWAIAIFFIGFIIYKLFFTDGLFAKRSAKIIEPQPDEVLPLLNEYSEYNLLITEAEQKSDYNLSARYLYLQTLKRLTDRGFIQFSPDKTNHSYVKELAGKSYQQAFASLTLNYEYVWYGKHKISESRYRQLKEEFISFNKKM